MSDVGQYKQIIFDLDTRVFRVIYQHSYIQKEKKYYYY